ncbi:alpha/beta hydrolase [Granulicatella adiacens]|jgi:hypothetical protein|uniref:alpha/beta hydrolase n=1 Tax=Granulicatella adiacens TaxID=46124 RepID=UPI000F112361|nr:alpha/beta hydrolase [Granulicatella adiacens]MCT2160347.1 alpha/beta hydrolase [Granulicatella adiacens]RKV62719.1 MAG: hypothetical protein D8H99_74250 [Streptococcus sp.]
MPYDKETVLDGTIPTLDASELSYEFEKARIQGSTDKYVVDDYSKTENAVMPPTFKYVSSFRDNATGTSGVAFKDTTTGKVIIAYTGTNLDSDGFKDAIMTDVISIALGTGHHYAPAYQFYEKVLKENGLNPEDIILTGHSLGGNIAQRVALKYNAPKTIVYNPAPLYVPIGAALSPLLTNPLLEITIAKNISEIENERKQFTGSVTRITTEKDPLNNWADRFGGLYLGEEYVIPNSGGHLMGDLRAVSDIIQKIEQSSISLESVEKSTQDKIKKIQIKKRRFKVNDIGKSLSTGLSKAELIALDSEQALAVASGISTAVTAATTLIDARVKSAVKKSMDLYGSLGDVPFGFLLSSDEVRATYNECGVNYGSVVEVVDSHCQSVSATANILADSFVELETKIKSGIAEIVQKDKEIEGLIRHG